MTHFFGSGLFSGSLLTKFTFLGDGEMTFGELQQALYTFTEEQLLCDLTVELGLENECFPAKLCTAGEYHDSLDENHPIIFVNN